MPATLEHEQISAERWEVGLVNRAEGTMRDVSILTGETEALGHRVYVDRKSIEQAASLLVGKSLPAFATHGGIFAGDRLLDQIGIFSGFYIDGSKLRARQFQFLRAFEEHHKAERDTLLELAEKMPDGFGVSIVFSGKRMWRMSDGSEKPWDGLSFDPPPGATGKLPCQRFTTIESADFVKTPAANPDGLFSKPTPAVVDAPSGDMDSTQIANSSEASVELRALSAEPETATFGVVAPLASNPADLKIIQALERDAATNREAWEAERTKLAAEVAAAKSTLTAVQEQLESTRTAFAAEKADLERKLALAESLSAARLGVSPLSGVTGAADSVAVTADTFWALYDRTPPAERSAFYQQHIEIARKARR